MRSIKFVPFANRAILLGFLAFSTGLQAQSGLTKIAGEYPIVGTIPGDQVGSHVALGGNGGWIVWHDNATDNDGLGISAQRINSSLSGDLSTFRVNQNGIGDQENAKVALLSNGGAAFVWQGGRQGFHKIFARFLSPQGVFTTGDLQVNVYTNQHQIHPSIAGLKNGNVAIAWSSYGQDGSLAGVYARVLSPSGAPVSGEIKVNQTTLHNQRNPSVAALTNGNFVVVWASERQRSFDTNDTRLQFYVDIKGQLIDPTGTLIGSEFLVNSGTNISAHPSVAATDNGGFIVGYSQLDTMVSSNSWDVFTRTFNANGAAQIEPVRLNTYLHGDQVAPKLASRGNHALAVWTSLKQDGSFDGVFGQYLNLNGNFVGSELQVNATTISKQFQPSVAVDSAGTYLAVWSSFTGGPGSFDLFAQRLVDGEPAGLFAPSAPYVAPVSSTAFSVTWPPMSGYSVDFYEVHVGGVAEPIVVTNLFTTVNGFTPGTTHSFRLLYQLTDGRRSPLSTPTSGTTWGADNNSDGLPDDWQAAQWGADPANWPSANEDSDGDGASNFQEFLAGTDPKDPTSVLRTRLSRTPQGFVFVWNTQPGMIYQVQVADNLGAWTNYGAPRFAHGKFDSVSVPAGSAATFYRVIRLR